MGTYCVKNSVYWKHHNEPFVKRENFSNSTAYPLNVFPYLYLA